MHTYHSCHDSVLLSDLPQIACWSRGQGERENGLPSHVRSRQHASIRTSVRTKRVLAHPHFLQRLRRKPHCLGHPCVKSFIIRPTEIVTLEQPTKKTSSWKWPRCDQTSLQQGKVRRVVQRTLHPSWVQPRRQINMAHRQGSYPHITGKLSRHLL